MKKFEEIKKQFKIFEKHNLIYLDSAATAQKPDCVLQSMQQFYNTENANPYRGAYGLSVTATESYNRARHSVAQFINAKDDEIIFTKNATEALNLVAYSYGLDNLKKDDEVVLSIMEHHSVIVPWQKIAKQKKAKLKYLYIDKHFEISESEIENKITPKTKVVCVLSVSNVLGTKNDVEKIIKKAHSVGAVVVVDASQSVAHSKIDVKKLDADFLVFSAHKMYGPMGIGVLYGKKELLENMTPFLCGGDMIEFVHEQETTFAPLPNKFEAGTQNVAGAVGLAEAIKFLNEIGFSNIERHENSLTEYAYKQLTKLPFVTIYASSKPVSAISFNVKKIHAHDVASFLDSKNICVRSGNHCAQPLLRFLREDSTCRLSIGIYNTKADVDALIDALKELYEKFKKYIKD